MRIFPKTVSAETVIENAINGLLTPLMTYIPQAANAALQALGNGNYPRQAGQALVKALQAWQEQIVAEADEKRLALIRQVSDLERQAQTQEHQCLAMQKEIQDNQYRIRSYQIRVDELENTITAQNRLLTQKHNHLMALLGNTENDAHT
ncbi:MAG: hypothetical protein KKD28_07370 [Chloroflexi bacterium]|nr:hypothetical protein [Chloroflexota bacterium]